MIAYSSHFIDSKGYNKTVMMHHVREYYCLGSPWSMSCWHGTLWRTVKVQLAYVHTIGEPQVPKVSALSAGSENFIPQTDGEDEMK